MEDVVVARVDEVFDVINKGDGQEKYCTCDLCRLDIICYTLNRVRPHYIASNRGVSRAQKESFEWQQQIADITALIHEGFRLVKHNQRPNTVHLPSGNGNRSALAKGHPVFNIPAITGRLFDGNNFAPISDVYIELLCDGHLVPMKDANWQNPYHLVSQTEGGFSFWPEGQGASKADEEKSFEYTLKVVASGYETLNHFFKVTVTSEIQTAVFYTLRRTFKLPSLYMFPPGESEQNG